MALTGQVNTQVLGRGNFQECDLSAAFSGVAAWSQTVLNNSNHIDSQSLTETRLQLHYALQFMAAVGNFLTEPQPDYSHTSLTWNSELKVFVSDLVNTEQPFQVALEPVSLTSLVLDAEGNKLAEFSLPQKTLDEGMNWLKQTIAPLGADIAHFCFLS